jgi:hypothetical protein
VQNILPQHRVRHGTTAYSKLSGTSVNNVGSQDRRTHQIPQSRSTASFFKRLDVDDDEERHDGRGAGTVGTAIPAAAHCSTKALLSRRFDVLAEGDSAPRSR